MGPAITFFLLLLLYLLPSMIGAIRGAKQNTCNGIFVLNLFLGWTIIGWIIALIWAVSAEKEIKK